VSDNSTTNFRVTATDAAGNPSTCSDPLPYVEDSATPETTITGGPTGTTTSSTVAFSFTSSETSSTFRCSIDGGAFTACTSPATFGPLSNGVHTFRVQATDAAGNTDPSPTFHEFTVGAIVVQPKRNCNKIKSKTKRKKCKRK
jgi:hypothetical protein